MKIFSKSVVLLIVLASITFGQETADQSAKDKPLFGAYIGIGYAVLSGNLSDYVNNPFILPITGDFIYKGFVAQLNVDAGYSRVKKTMFFNDGSSWREGGDVWHNALGVNVGYGVFNNMNLRVTPVVGYAYSYLASKWWGTSEISNNEPDTHNLTVGLLFDLKNVFSKKSAESDDSDYLGLRISAGAYIPMSDADVYPNYFNGATIFISVGIINLSLLP
ncbi:MAG: hypothetical protein GXO87_12955 [Chlorobi bacterium]|nr:hypothetical protein [Chlorobiota bacterium]